MFNSSFTVENWDDDQSDDILTNNRNTSFFGHKLNEEDIEIIKFEFNKYDKKKLGFINLESVISLFQMCGQNPSFELQNTILTEVNKKDIGMVFLNDLIPIFEKYWKTKDQTRKELENAIKILDSTEEEVVDLNVIKESIKNYGEKLDKNDMYFFEKLIKSGDDKIYLDELLKKLQVDDEQRLKLPKSKKSKNKPKDNK